MTTTFDAKLHEYRVDGIVRPGPSKVLAAVGLSDASHYTEGSAEKGRARHEAIFLCQKGFISAFSFSDEIQPYLKAWSKFGLETGFHVETQEEIRTHPSGAYCGTPDLTGWFRGYERGGAGVVDIKTGGLEVWHGVQLAAYRDLTKLRNGWILQLKADGSYRLIDESKGFDGVVRKFTDPYWARIWNAALTLYQCKEAA